MLFAAQLLRVVAGVSEILGVSVLVYARTGSALLSAIAYGAGFLPQLLGGALFTAAADRFPPRALLAVQLLTRAVPGAVIGLINLPVGAMLGLIALVTCFYPMYGAAVGGLLPEVLDGDRYVLGRSMMGAVASGGQVLGLGVGGAVLALLSAQQLMLAAAAALVAAAAVVRLRLGHRPARAAGGGRGSVHATIAGNRALLADRRVRGLLLAQWLPASFVTGAESLIVAYVGALGKPESTASALLVALPIGMLAGNLVVGRFCRPRTRERLSFPMAALMGLPLLAFALLIPVPVGTALLVLTGAGFGYELGLQRRFVDALPNHLQGQGFGLRSAGLMGGQGAGTAAAGGLAAALGPGGAMAAAGGACVLVGLSLYRTLTGRESRRGRHSDRSGATAESSTPPRETADLS